MIKSITIDVPGQPVAKGRPRFTRGGFAYTPAKTARYEQRVRAAALRVMDGSPPLEGPIALRLMFNMEVPKSWPKKKRADAFSGKVLPISRPDIDNICKCVIDGLNGVLFKDDSQITDLIASKRYGVPCVKVIASRIEGSPPA